ncbi:MAG: MYXO-CTERM sorting domain-containing protein, partial [Kofleriaceae bacterium]
VTLIARADVATGEVVLATNDPNQPSVTVSVGRDIGGTGIPDGDDDSAAHAGCNAGGRQGAAIALALLAILRRRRR